MPGRLILETPIATVATFLGADAGVVEAEPPRRNVAPGQEIVVCPPDRTLVRMRWGMIPVGRVNARGRPVMETIVNARSETVFAKSAFAGVRRAIVPADGWYEWTGPVRRKTAWRIGRRDGRPLAFAAIWDVWTAPGGRELAQVATLTCAPNADVAAVHDRMGVLLEPADVAQWLDGDETEAGALLRPYPDGLLAVTEAKGVDWTRP
jgi:putative SOS response-associated peptidase YedK